MTLDVTALPDVAFPYDTRQQPRHPVEADQIVCKVSTPLRAIGAQVTTENYSHSCHYSSVHI